MRHSRRLVAMLAVVLVLVTAAAGWAAFAPIAPGPREALFVIPKGTGARIAAGKTAQALPARIRLTVGVRDLLIIRNEDDQPQSLGPVLLAAGQTYRVPFSAPATFDFACSAHDEGQITIVVAREPVAGWRRLVWRIDELLDRWWA
jgi:hypothetical protein